MNEFGDFLYKLRKEKGMTQAELADKLNVTNKAVSKWETGEAMPETSLLLPLSRILDISVDELLDGKRNQKDIDEDEIKNNSRDDNFNEKSIHNRGKDDDNNKTFTDKIGGVICALIMFLGITAYLIIGITTNMWHPYWAIVAISGLTCGIVGSMFDLLNPRKCEAKSRRGENPYTGAICGVVMLICIASYIFIGAFFGLWHPYWLIPAIGGISCGVIGAIGTIFTKK